MTDDSEEPEVSEAPLETKPRFSVVIILSILIGVLLTVGVAGAYIHLQKSHALEEEVLAAREDLKEKSVALEEMKTQIEALSRQMNALKEFSIARSGSANEKTKKNEVPTPAVEAAATVPSPDVQGADVVPAVPVPPKIKKTRPKPDGQSCELVGKSPEEQAATLQRCVGVMDAPNDKTKAR